MYCERCKGDIPEGGQREHHGKILCEDCFIDSVSTLKACDPWAVHSAQSFSKGGQLELTPTQKSILEVLERNGPIEPKRLSERVGLEERDLEREIAALRHMEKVRGELKDGKKRIRLW
ncbi:MAG: hypothetical protein C4530_21985 [Desulfobacteraceae bacterium]|nr:MAG: hypothetical protein C4530_21985 [Desulfobacteraceae bacterium]